MSDTRKDLDGDLRGVATGWLAAKGVEGPSPATQAARRADLAGVAACLADVLERPDAGLPAGTSTFDQHLAQVCVGLSRHLAPESPASGQTVPHKIAVEAFRDDARGVGTRRFEQGAAVSSWRGDRGRRSRR